MLHLSKINLKRIKNGIYIISSSAFIFQVVLYPLATNIIYNILVLLAIYTSSAYLFRTKTFLQYPLSSLMILGYCIYYFILPPIVTISINRPLINNLNAPIFTCLHSLLFFLTLIISHILYRKLLLSSFLKAKVSKLYFKLKIFNYLSALHIYSIGFIGVVAQIILLYFDEKEINQIVLKLCQGISFFVYFPFLLLSSNLFGIKNRNKFGPNFKIIYPIITILLGIAVNSRSYVFEGFVLIIFAYFFSYLYGHKKLSLSFKSLIGIVLLVVFITGPASKVAAAMILVRDQRDNISALELIHETIFTYNSQNKNLESFQLRDYTSNDTWDEEYSGNVFLDRLCNLKYADNSLVLATKMDESKKKELIDDQLNKTVSILPEPLIEALDLKINKTEATSYSTGDMMLYIVIRDFTYLGGFRTGSLFGNLFVMFDWAYPLILGFLAFIAFCIVDPLVRFQKSTFLEKNSIIKPKFEVIFSPIALLSFYFFCFYFTSAAKGSESFYDLMLFSTRTWFEKPFIFFIMISLLNIFFRLLNIKIYNFKYLRSP